MNCRDVDEVGAAFAARALDAGERRQILEHLRNCEEPHEDARMAPLVAPLLASSEEPVEPPPALRQRLMATIAATPQEHTPQRDRSGRPAAPVRDERARPFMGWLPPSFARGLAVGGVTAALALAVVGGSLYAQLRDRDEALQSLAATIAAGDTALRVSGQAGSGYLVERQGEGAALILADVQGLPADRLYELWLIPEQGAPTAVGTFRPSDDEITVVPVEDDLDGYAVFAMTVEAARVSPPTTDPVLVAPLEG
jgi:anti-sigma-K factor RskA